MRAEKRFFHHLIEAGARRSDRSRGPSLDQMLNFLSFDRGWGLPFRPKPRPQPRSNAKIFVFLNVFCSKSSSRRYYSYSESDDSEEISSNLSTQDEQTMALNTFYWKHILSQTLYIFRGFRFFFETLNGRLPLKHGSDRRETLPKKRFRRFPSFQFSAKKHLFHERFRSR